MSDKVALRYVAFLRGINVGGSKKVPMKDLKEAFESLGLSNVRTLLASGNVIFDSPIESPARLQDDIENKLNEAFGFPVKTIVKNLRDIQKLVALAPFKDIKVTKNMRLFVTILPERPDKRLKVPYETPDGSFRILKVTDDAVFSIFTIMETRWATGVNIIEKQFGKDVTTRNWNTILKIGGM